MDLNPEWVVGFVDGEGCFFIGIQKNPKTSLGYQVIPEFRIVQHERDIAVLHALKRFFKFGTVCQNHGDRYELRVRKLEHLREIADFFLRRPLKTKKNVDFLKFRDVLLLMERGEHLTMDGLKNIARIASQMNTGKREALSSLLDEDIVHASSKDENYT